MGWLRDIIDALRDAAAMAERVESLSAAVTDLTKEMRSLDRRLSRLEGALAATGVRLPAAQDRQSLPSSEDGD